MDYGYKPTTNGSALIAKCLALGEVLEFTRVAFGSGCVEEGDNLATMHELISYVADGTFGKRSHKNGRLELCVQYENINNPNVPTFYINEFIVYAKDPETGEEVDILYATLGDFKQPIPAYDASQPPSVWRGFVVLVVSEDVNVVVSGTPGLVGHDELEEILGRAEQAVEDARKAIEEAKAAGFPPEVEVYDTADGGYRIYVTDKNGRRDFFVPKGKDANVLIAIAGKTSSNQIAAAVKERRPVCAIWTQNGQVMWMKDASVSSEGKLEYAIFADGSSAMKVTSGLAWTDEGIEILPRSAGVFQMASKEEENAAQIVEDYTAQFDFRFTGEGLEPSGNIDNRDEGLHIRPLHNITNPLIDKSADGTRKYQYTVRLSAESGAQLIYGISYYGDYSGVLAGYRSSGSGDTLPKSLEKDKTYTVKIAKVGDTLKVKVWETGTGEPAWQCSYSNENISDGGGIYKWGFELCFNNKVNYGVDTERAVISNMVFTLADGSTFWDGVTENELTAREVFAVNDGGSWGEVYDLEDDMPRSGGKFTGPAYAADGLDNSAQMRNIRVSDVDLVAGESALPSGEIYLVYE